jgi:periplasmic divalent cation tolerance protein
MTTAVEVVVTGPPEFIDQYCRQLVEDRLIACAQVAQIHSTYRWQGEVEREPEARAAMHTLRSAVSAIAQRTRDEHPYDVPCILVLPIQDGNPDYLEWIADSVDTRSTGGGD